MLKIRMVEEAIAERYYRQKMRCPVHLCIGQEAISVGVCEVLGPMDSVYSNHRSHGHYLAKGGRLDAMIAELHGKVDGCCRGKGGSMHLIDLAAGFSGAVPIVGSTLPIAVGHALAHRIRNEDAISVVFFGDGTIEEGVFHESLNFAALKKLKVLFVCENNAFSVYSPLSVRQPPNRSNKKIVEGHGFYHDSGDGNDVLEVYEKTRQSIDHMKATGQPSFLEFETFRWREHCGPNFDNDLGYRTECDFKDWVAKCPIKRFIAYLKGEKRLSEKTLASLTQELEKEIAGAFEKADNSPWPDSDTAKNPVYA